MGQLPLLVQEHGSLPGSSGRGMAGGVEDGGGAWEDGSVVCEGAGCRGPPSDSRLAAPLLGVWLPCSGTRIVVMMGMSPSLSFRNLILAVIPIKGGFVISGYLGVSIQKIP